MYNLICSDLAKYPLENGMEPSDFVGSKFNQDNPYLLHRLVSEGSVNGVRLVY